MRRIRILISMLGLDQHELGAIAVARALRDAGMEVIYAGRFNLPSMILHMALEEDVDVIGLSCHSWEYLYYAPELVRLLNEKELSVPVVLGGSVITSRDAQAVVAKGVAAAFGPASSNDEIVETIRRLVPSGEESETW